MSKTSGQNVKGAENRSKAIALRKEGSTYEEIGKTLSISTQRAHKIVTSELTRIRKETAEETDELRTLELQRLDAMFMVCYRDAQEGDYPAVDRCLKIMERRAKLLGLDMPVKIAQTDSDGNDILVSREWIQIRGVVLEALDAGDPAIKARVLDALALLETQHSAGEKS
jgi:hypothetical protein